MGMGMGDSRGGGGQPTTPRFSRLSEGPSFTLGMDKLSCILRNPLSSSESMFRLPF